jgi:quinohemoprotein ethanol dehydrogenase
LGRAFGLAAGELARDAHLAANIPRVLVFKLGGTAKLPELPPAQAATVEPPAEIGDEAAWTAGKAVYHTNCSVVPRRLGGQRRRDPGPAAVADHPRSGGLGRIVRGGERTARGMVSFAAEVSAEDSEKVRSYVIHRAHEVWNIEKAAVAAPPAAVPSPPPAAPK